MKKISIASLLAALVMLAACTSAPIMNVESQAILPTFSGQRLSEDQVKLHILKAGTQLGWQMQNVAPGKIHAALDLRVHHVEVNIAYSATSYSIQHDSSRNMDYNASKNTIHRQYNNWIKNLQRGINAELSSAQAQ